MNGFSPLSLWCLGGYMAAVGLIFSLNNTGAFETLAAAAGSFVLGKAFAAMDAYERGGR